MGLTTGGLPGALERPVAAIGRAVAWLTLAMVLLTFGIVVLRYGFSLGWIWLQETVTYMHAVVFMAAAGWTLQEDGHVRVDIFYRDLPARRQAAVNLAGTILFVAPLCVFLFLVGWDYVASSWKLMEKSREAGGVPLVYLLKTLILVLPALLLLQSIPGAFRSLAALRGDAGGGGAG